MLVTPDDVRDELAFDSDALGMDDEAFEALLERLIGRETPRVADAIDASLEATPATETVSRPEHVPEHDLPLKDRPVRSVESVEIDTDRVHGPDVDVDEDVIVNDTHIALAADADRTRWPTDRRSIVVEYEHGYSAADVPEPIRGAIVGLVRQALQEVEADGIQQESIGGDSVSYELGEAVVARHLRRAKQFEAPSYYGGAGVI